MLLVINYKTKMTRKIIFTSTFFLIFFILYCFNAKGDVFSVHLFYDSNKKALFFDNESEENVSLDKEEDISIVEYAIDNSTGAYIIKLYDISGNVFSQNEFNPKVGKFDYKMPYFSVAEKMEIFEKSTNKKILETNLSNYLTCNGNGTCEFEKGENIDSCIGDCASSNVRFSQETKKILDKNNGILKDEKTGATLLKGNIAKEQVTNENVQSSSGKMWSIVLIVVMSLIVISVIYFIIRKKIIRK